jgi:hypothetical protein
MTGPPSSPRRQTLWVPLTHPPSRRPSDRRHPALDPRRTRKLDITSPVPVERHHTPRPKQPNHPARRFELPAVDALLRSWRAGNGGLGASRGTQARSCLSVHLLAPSSFPLGSLAKPTSCTAVVVRRGNLGIRPTTVPPTDIAALGKLAARLTGGTPIHRSGSRLDPTSRDPSRCSRGNTRPVSSRIH